jgi:transposase
LDRDWDDPVARDQALGVVLGALEQVEAFVDDHQLAQFAAVFATRDRAAVSPARLALVSVLQFVEGLSDRQAADAVRGRIDWKYALGLELADTGFDASVLTEFRAPLGA